MSTTTRPPPLKTKQTEHVGERGSDVAHGNKHKQQASGLASFDSLVSNSVEGKPF